MTNAVSFPARPASFDGFVHSSGTKLVDGSGRELLLRGMGIGNWMLPEGYMWKFGPGAESPREIETLVSRLIGAPAAAEFWTGFREAFFNEADIARIAASGFDHVRLPINSRLVIDDDGIFIETGFVMIDDVIAWCRKHGLWVLLDLHGAPGGQTGTNIDDSPNNRPELFMDARYRDLTITLWREFARRYADETAVLGYDLLNEPIPNEWTEVYNADLAALYRELTRVIREVDSNHLIVYEGSHWATNWDVFTEVWDDNSCLQFHKYWSPPDTSTIQKFLKVRDSLGLPIYMGEGGENNLEWLYTAWRLYESNDIGWNFWPWKKIDTRTSPASIKSPSGWADIVAHIADGSAVSRETAHAAFDELLVNMRLENCVWQPEIIQAITAVEPVEIPAWGFGFRGHGVSYSTSSARPLADMRDTDAVTILYAAATERDGHWFEQTDGRDYSESERMVVTLAAGEWLEYEMTGVDDLARVSVTDELGGHADVALSRSVRGFRVTAPRGAVLARITVVQPGPGRPGR